MSSEQTKKVAIAMFIQASFPMALELTPDRKTSVRAAIDESMSEQAKLLSVLVLDLQRLGVDVGMVSTTAQGDSSPEGLLNGAVHAATAFMAPHEVRDPEVLAAAAKRGPAQPPSPN